MVTSGKFTHMIWILLVVAYFMGSIPSGVIIARSRGVDLLKSGSGNIGATNALRVLGTKWGLLVFLLDMLKGTIPALAARLLLTQDFGWFDAHAQWFVVGFTAILGHMFSPWLGFKGGKGIATGIGMALAAAPAPGLLAFTGFLIVAYFTRYISVASTVAIWLAPTIAIFWPGESKLTIPFYLVIAVFVTVKHGKNYERLRKGTESKFSFKKSEPVVPGAVEGPGDQSAG